MPVSKKNQKLENLFPKLLLPGTDSWFIFLAPIMSDGPEFSNLLMNAGRSFAKCCPSLSIVIA
jgi:hypothetical protein